ncbi:MAG: glycosyl hydrolase 115 family protein [Verrucomicrobiota bacterium JB022]|nr:glycosyl hydrolase 115 family protein [Verrucomicrobiota bacterium JB022]
MPLTSRLARLALLGSLCLAGASPLAALDDFQLVEFAAPQKKGAFPLFAARQTPPTLVVEASAPAGLKRAGNDLAGDLQAVTGKEYTVAEATNRLPKQVVLLATAGESPLLDQLVQAGKLDLSAIDGKWEAFQIEVVEKPWPGVEQALVVVGSDLRGAIYGTYTLSEHIGVSPWYWWADVPVDQHDALYWPQGRRHVDDGPTVQYRGIFLNDEAPALTGWVNEKFGGYNHQFYEHVFELLLRLKANYLWPAMWDAAFNDDDPLNAELAAEYGIVMGTSHHEPMMRAHKEWRKYGEGRWDYSTNEETLREFWQGALERNRDHPNIITLGMRGDGDEAMSEETNVALLERIVDDQRAMIAEAFGRPLEDVPQVWALYKEVQSYYEHGMRVPDDVTLLWCDDNWGNIRRLPRPEERTRSGGAGVYYHFDYVGDPRSYKWINSAHLPRVWEQMHLAWQYDANKIWIVNVGDLKPMEYPIEFFLTYAWDPAKWPYERLTEYSERWATREFGPEQAEDIAQLMRGYSHLNSRRKPELLSPEVYNPVAYREAERVLAEWQELVELTDRVSADLPAAYQDAYFQLVDYPVKASAVVNELYLSAAWNRVYAPQGRTATNAMADRARELFAQDAELALAYNEDLADGKWSHFMDQNNLGYTIWQQPEREFMPAVTWMHAPKGSEMAVALEGRYGSWPTHDIFQGPSRLPVLTSLQGGESRWIEVFNRSQDPFDYTVKTSQPWVKVSGSSGKVSLTERLEVSVDWTRVPVGDSEAQIEISGPHERTVMVTLPLRKYAPDHFRGFSGFVETNGYVSMPASGFSRNLPAGDLAWRVLEDFGNAHDGVTPFPVLAEPVEPIDGQSPRLEYDFYLESMGEAELILSFSPTFDFQSEPGIRFAVSVDGQEPQVHGLGLSQTDKRWEEAVAHNLLQIRLPLNFDRTGKHTLKVWMIDPGPVLQHLQLDLGGLQPSYLGAPASPRVP